MPSSPIYPRNPVSASLGIPQSSLSYGGVSSFYKCQREGTFGLALSGERPLD